jgi:hypothetical protein
MSHTTPRASNDVRSLQTARPGSLRQANNPREQNTDITGILRRMSINMATEGGNHYTYCRVEVCSYLFATSSFIAAKVASEAELTVKLARDAADRSNDPLLVAKCDFWMGRVELLRENISKSHEHFVKANACAMDPNEGVECQDLSLYLDITRHGISPETRAERLRAHYEAIVRKMKFNRTDNNSVTIEFKRKRPLRTWKGTLVKMQLPLIKQRPLTKIMKPRCRVRIQQKMDEEHMEQGVVNEMNSKNEVLGLVLAEELGYESWGDSGEDTDTDTETEDEYEGDPNGGPGDDSDDTAGSETDSATDDNATNSQAAPTDPQRSESSADPAAAPASVPSDQAAYEMPEPGSARDRFRQECFRMGLTSNLNGEPYQCPKEPFMFGEPHEPTHQTRFRLGVFKVGLANRSRPMTIFPKQAGEITISPQEWESIEQDIRGSIVTYDYLRRERYELAKVARDM